VFPYVGAALTRISWICCSVMDATPAIQANSVRFAKLTLPSKAFFWAGPG
jgi:hypothetical protein